jgi:hypothetical protein
MLIKILPGEYLFSPQGTHILDEQGFAVTATEETEVEIEDESQLAVVAAYHAFVRPESDAVEAVIEEIAEQVSVEPAQIPKPEQVPEPIPEITVEPVISEETL